MNAFHCKGKKVALAGLIGMLFVVLPVRAQNQVQVDPERLRQYGITLGQLGALTTKQVRVPIDLLTTGVSIGQALGDVIFQDAADGMLGATLQPVGDTLRAQLDIPAGQGLLVTSLREDGASARAGLKQNDVLLSLAGKPLATPEDLTKQLKEAGDSAVALEIVRAGKRRTIQVRPIYRVTLGPAGERKAEYYIGVNINPPDDAVRAQLGLPAGQGVVVNEVVGGSPAEKAGVRKHDIILELGGKRINSPEALARQVQTDKGKPTALKILRGGKVVTIPITAIARKVEANPPTEAAFRLLTVDPSAISAELRYDSVLRSVEQANRDDLARALLAAPAGSDDLRQRLGQVEKEVKALRTAVEKLNETLKARMGTKRE